MTIKSLPSLFTGSRPPSRLSQASGSVFGPQGEPGGGEMNLDETTSIAEDSVKLALLAKSKAVDEQVLLSTTTQTVVKDEASNISIYSLWCYSRFSSVVIYIIYHSFSILWCAKNM